MPNTQLSVTANLTKTPMKSPFSLSDLDLTDWVGTFLEKIFFSLNASRLTRLNGSLETDFISIRLSMVPDNWQPDTFLQV